MPKHALPTELIKLREIYSSGISVKVMLDDFSNRTNNQRITKVDQLLTRLRTANIQRGEAIALFRKLEEFGHGKFIEGRKGHPSRFVWSSSPIDVGKAAQGDDTLIAPVSIDAVDEEGSAELRSYVFPLRSGTDANLKLPSDMTQREAQRLSAFIQTLAISDE